MDKLFKCHSLAMDDSQQCNHHLYALIQRVLPTIALAALNAGKSVYNEKPLALPRQEGQTLAGVIDPPLLTQIKCDADND